MKHIAFGPTFSERVVALAREIPAGRVSTYGSIARAAGGGTMASRSVTGILARAWEMGVCDIPWHRIVYSDGRVWIDDVHAKERLRLYKKEGIELDEKNRIIDFGEMLYEFK